MRHIRTLAICGGFLLIAAALPPEINGDWYGNLLTPSGVSLPLVLHIHENSVTLDSPAQGADGIRAELEAKDGKFEVDVPTIGARFSGELSGNKTLTGTFSQGGLTLPLELNQQTSITRSPPVRRPQEPKPPFPYLSADVTIEAAPGVSLSGTLTRPRGREPKAAVILVPGTGPMDRDETVAGHKPFLVLADRLTRSGVAVLRLDKRGVGRSTGTFESATTSDLVSDIRVALRWLRHQPGIDSRRVGLIGHSEGAALIPEVAAQDSSVAFLILLSPPGVTGDKVILSQISAIDQKSGVSAKKETKQQALERSLLQVAEDTPNRNALEASAEKLLMSRNISPERSHVIAEQLAMPAFVTMLTYDPTKFLRKLSVPILVIAGGRDLQVVPSVNLPPIRRALSHDKLAEFLTIPNANHLLQPAHTGLPDEYIRIDETIDPRVLEIISSWVSKTVARTLSENVSRSALPSAS